jgi:hypothetical protein
MSDRTKIAAATTNLVLVPLSKLKKSPKKVRKIPRTKADPSLVASIAALGMLEHPLVEPELGPRGKSTGHYLVNTGEAAASPQSSPFRPRRAHDAVGRNQPMHP